MSSRYTSRWASHGIHPSVKITRQSYANVGLRAPTQNENGSTAAENARAKAEVLCAASGAKLGKLLHIRYGRNEAEVCSRTNVMFACDEAAPRAKGIALRPDDIRVSDTATFIWAIEH